MRPHRVAVVALLLMLSAVSAGCGARLTPEQRNAVVGDGAGAAGGRGSVEGVETGGGR